MPAGRPTCKPTEFTVVGANDNFYVVGDKVWVNCVPISKEQYEKDFPTITEVINEWP